MYVFTYQKLSTRKVQVASLRAAFPAFVVGSAFEELGLNEWCEPAVSASSRGYEVGAQGSQVGVCGVVNQVTVKSSETMGEATQILE